LLLRFCTRAMPLLPLLLAAAIDTLRCC
jgi:hypothetical protein